LPEGKYVRFDDHQRAQAQAVAAAEARSQQAAADLCNEWAGKSDAAISALRAEVTQLKADAERTETLRNADEWPMCPRDEARMEEASQAIEQMITEANALRAEVERLTAENAALRAKGARYEWQ
jgi:hypothetical protein